MNARQVVIASAVGALVGILVASSSIYVYLATKPECDCHKFGPIVIASCSCDQLAGESCPVCEIA